MVEHRTQFAFKGKREHTAKVNMPIIAYPNQHIDIEIPHGSRDPVIVPDTVKITFNLNNESTDKARSVVNNVDRALVKKKGLMLGSKDIDVISNSDIYDTYKDLYLSKKERKEKLLQGIQLANGLNARVGAKEADGIALTVAILENAIKKTFDKRFGIPLDFDFFRHPVYPYGLKEDLIVRLDLNSAEKVILCTGDTNATYKLSDISLEYDAIFDEPYATTIGEMYTGKRSTPYTKVTLIHYQTLSKKHTTWKIGVNKLSFCSLQGLLLLFLDKRDDFVNKNEKFYNPSIKKLLTKTDGMSYQLFAAGLQARDIYPELKKYFYREYSNVTWEEFLTTKFGLWIDTRSSTNNTLHGSGRAVEKSGILLQIEKAAETSGGDTTCCGFSLEEAVTHLSVTDLSGILTIGK